jgi:hypothetical protein
VTVRWYLLIPLLFPTLAPAADRWIEYRYGPFRVLSDAGDKPARERLTELEQLRFVLGVMLGKDSLGVGGPRKNELATIWPIDVVLFATAREYGPHALPKPFVDGGSATLAAWAADTPLPRDLLRALTRLLIDENAGRMPDSIETALCDLFSTIKVVNGIKVLLGTPLPPGELPPDRMHAWAKMQLVATNPDYTGKIRVYLNNLQGGGDESLATRNAFGMTTAQLNTLVDQYVRAGKFEAAFVSNEPMNPNQDFVEKPVGISTVDPLLAELASAGKNFPPDSPRGLVAKNNRPALELAAKANPRWGEPHFRLAQLETDTAARIKELKTAATLEPRNSAYWQALAEAQTAADQYADADKSWSAAEKAAPTEADRARIRQTRVDLDEQRAAFEAALKKRTADEEARHLQQIKNAAAAEVHAAEDSANRKLGGLKSDKVPEQWWEDPQGEKVSGKLARVDCLNGPVRLTIQIDGGGTIKLLIRDPKQLVVHGTNDATFGCGIQRPVRTIKAVYNVKADAKLGTVGDVAMVEFP